MSSHEGHDHPATKAARAACRKGKTARDDITCAVCGTSWARMTGAFLTKPPAHAIPGQEIHDFAEREHGNADLGSGIRTKADWEKASKRQRGLPKNISSGASDSPITRRHKLTRAEQAEYRQLTEQVEHEAAVRKLGMPYWDRDDEGREHCSEPDCDFSIRGIRSEGEREKIRTARERVKHLNSAHGQSW